MLEEYLNAKPLYYDEIDYTRMPRVYARIRNYFKNSNVIHLIGTNGKGTTGRFLATALYAKGYSVGHYTSPHIFEFNERIWLNGHNVSNDILEEAHQTLQTILKQEESDSLSYFEYTTLLAMYIFQSCDYIVLEAGLGGEYDATAVFEKLLTLVTPIDRDHEAFLGDTIEKIAQTKLNAIKNRAILAMQPNSEVYRVAQELAQQKSLKIQRVEELLEEFDYKKIKTIAANLSLAPYLIENLKLSVSALKLLGIEHKESDFNNSRLFGRMSTLSENIILDVGHNVLAAKSLYSALKGNKYILIYSSYKDKNYKAILDTLKPIIQHVELISVDDERIEEDTLLSQTLEALDIEYTKFHALSESESYLVFGSFKVAEAFLKYYYEK